MLSGHLQYLRVIQQRADADGHEVFACLEGRAGKIRHYIAAGSFDLCNLVFEEFQATRKRLEEALLVAAHAVGDEGAAVFEFGVHIPHLVDDRIRNLEEEGTLDAQQNPVPAGTAQDAAQHVAPALVRREHAVPHQKGQSARMVGHDPQRNILLGIFAEGHAGHLLGARQDRSE